MGRRAPSPFSHLRVSRSPYHIRGPWRSPASTSTEGQQPTSRGYPTPMTVEESSDDTSLEFFHFLGGGDAADASNAAPSTLLHWNPSILMAAIARWREVGSLGGRRRTLSLPWSCGVRSEGDKRGCRSWDRGVVPRGLPFIAQDDALSGTEPCDRSPMAKEPRVNKVPLSPRNMPRVVA